MHALIPFLLLLSSALVSCNGPTGHDPEEFDGIFRRERPGGVKMTMEQQEEMDKLIAKVRAIDKKFSEDLKAKKKEKERPKRYAPSEDMGDTDEEEVIELLIGYNGHRYAIGH